VDRDAAQVARGDAGLSCEVVSCFSSSGPGSRWSRQHHQVRAVRIRGRSTGLGSAPTRVSGCARPHEQAPPRCQPPADDLRFRHRTFLHCRRWMRRSSLQQVSEHGSMATVASWSQRSLRTIRATRSVGAKSANLSADRRATCLAAARTARSGRAHRRHPHDDGYCAQHRPARPQRSSAGSSGHGSATSCRRRTDRGVDTTRSRPPTAPTPATSETASLPVPTVITCRLMRPLRRRLPKTRRAISRDHQRQRDANDVGGDQPPPKSLRARSNACTGGPQYIHVGTSNHR